ncbi:MAG: sulfatase-like hydrolase/transferase [Opitutales bacterium]
MKPKGVIFFQVDQHRRDCLGHTGHNGHVYVQTPNLDRLAAEGMQFSRAYCPTPMCVPTRATYLCGQWPMQHGVLNNWDSESPVFLDPQRPTWARTLGNYGQSTDYIGRWHVRPDLGATDFGFTTDLPDWKYGKWREAEGIPPVPKANGLWGEVDPHITPAQSKVAWTVDRIIEAVKERTEQGEHFCIRAETIEPHLPCRPPASLMEAFPVKDIPPWGSFYDTFEGKPYAQAQQLRTWNIESWTWDDWAPVVARYLAEIANIDLQIGRLLDYLDEAGLVEDTLVIYTADHGDMCGGHRMIDKHNIMYDDVVRVPLLMRWPRQIAPGSQTEAFVINSIDLPPTFCDVFGVQPPASFSGKSLLPLMRGEGGEFRQSVYSTYHGNQFGPYSQRMVADRRYKYIWNPTAEDEFYDLERDPNELHNRATDPACQELLAQMRRRLIRWLEETDDRLLNRWTRAQLENGWKV